MNQRDGRPLPFGKRLRVPRTEVLTCKVERLASKFGSYSRSALLVIALATPAFAQGFYFGVKAGVPMTAYFETGRTASRCCDSEYSAATRRYTVGASAEWRLKHGIGFELDALYKRLGYVGIVREFNFGSGVLVRSAFDAKGNSWDFPLMAKYRFGRLLHPYVAGGGVLRHIGPVRARGASTIEDRVARTTVRRPIDTTEPSDLRKRLYPGVTIAGGIELGLGRLRLLPEIRYTRWTANIAGSGGLLRFDPHQAEFLLGLLF